MFRPLRMRHVSLWLVREDAPSASLTLAELGSFCPDAAEGMQLDVPDAAEKRYRDAYLSARSRLDRIAAQCEASPEARVPPLPQPVAAERLEALDARLGELWGECFEGAERVRLAEEERRRTEQLLGTLATFADLDLDLGALLKDHRFLDVRIGTVPAQNVSRLREALTLAGFLLDTFGEEATATRAIVVGPAGREIQIASLLATAGWRGIEVPPELRTHPEEARGLLTRRQAELQADIAATRAAVKDALHAHWEEIEAAETTLALARPYAEMVGKALRGRGGLTLMTGWVPKRDEERLTAFARAEDEAAVSPAPPRSRSRASGCAYPRSCVSRGC